jgi:hypothetical protein
MKQTAIEEKLFNAYEKTFNVKPKIIYDIINLRSDDLLDVLENLLHIETKAYRDKYKQMEDALKLSDKMLNHIKCINPSCDGNGAIQVTEDEWEPCQWCDERKSIKTVVETFKQ